MPKKNRVAIFEHLFKEGVMVAKKRSLRAQTSGIGECSQPPRHQSVSVSQVERNGYGTVRLETLLLVLDQRGYPVSPRLPPSSSRNRPRDVETGDETRTTPTRWRLGQAAYSTWPTGSRRRKGRVQTRW